MFGLSRREPSPEPPVLPDTTNDVPPLAYHCAWCEPYPVFAPNGATSGICSDCAAELQSQIDERRAKQAAS